MSACDLYADRMGSFSKDIDTTTGAIMADYSYDSYGAQVTHAASLFQHYGYTARESDPESGPQSSILIGHLGSWSISKFQLGF